MWKRFGGATLILAATAAAQDPTNRWSLSFGAGTNPSVSGLYHDAGIGAVLQLPTKVEERSWSDIYDAGFAMRIGGRISRHAVLRTRISVIGLAAAGLRNSVRLRVAGGKKATRRPEQWMF